jgi:TonB family protein
LPASPIDAAASKPKPTPALASSPAKSPKTSAKTSINQGSVSQPAASAQPISSSDIAVAAVTSEANIEANIQESVTAAEPTEPTDVQQAIQPAPASPTPTPASSTAAVQPESSPIPIPSPIPAATPSPLITPQRIDVPIPDVTGTLPIPADGAEDLSAVVTNQVTIPSHLTASLTTDSLPTEDSQTELDEAAQPKTEVQTFSSNPTRSPCVVTPEAVQFLGKTVAMQVATDETGKVVDTVTQESSDSRAYDELATCLVKNWSFEPAIARGEPVANDGLVVRITIDRS